jgi:hypothetical protein
MVVEAGWYNHYQQFTFNTAGSDEFATMWDYYQLYGEYIADENPGWQHEYMANYYIDDISAGLAALHPYLSSQAFINHYTGSYLPNGNEWNWGDFFTNLAWAGLHKTEEFQNQIVDNGNQGSFNWYVDEAQKGDAVNECN